ncbi:MAG: hypothetical protein DCC75_04410 [Proteobacteria bacterium]|nr:MAG: hypothetical protein DCC75_04410 [Pseudomonadota bacterium]
MPKKLNTRSKTRQFGKRSPSVSRVLIALLSCAVFFGCGDGSGSVVIISNFGGTWAVHYNLTADECFLLPEDVFEFDEDQEVAQDGFSIVLKSGTAFLQDYTGQIEEENKFVAEQDLPGLVFDGGLVCDIYQAISYEGTGENSVSSLFVTRINCNDGYICETRGIGAGERVQ